MNDVREGAVFGVDGCSTQDIPSSTGAERAARQTLSLEVISDAICPWCWVAKHRLDRAIAALGPETAVQVTWRPFELNPDMPKDGLDRRAYRSHKFGSWERSQALDGHVAEAARSDGLVFRHELIGRTPNTRDAHRLIWVRAYRVPSSKRCSPLISMTDAMSATGPCSSRWAPRLDSILQ